MLFHQKKALHLNQLELSDLFSACDFFHSPTKTEKQKTNIIAAMGCDKAAGSVAGNRESLILLEVMNKQKNSKYA